MASELESDLKDTVDLTGNGLLISLLEKLNWLHLTGLITLAIDVKMDGFVLEEKSSSKMLELNSASKLGRDHYLFC